MADSLSREQRIRKQAELQSLYNVLDNMRDRELTYIEASASIPELSINQTNEIRQRIQLIEEELFGPEEGTPEATARQFYREAFAAEKSGESDSAVKLYKKASRYDHRDADEAVRSLRYRMKRKRRRAAAQPLLPLPQPPLRNRLIAGVAAVLICTPLALFAFYWDTTPTPPEAAAIEFTSTPTLTATAVAVQLIVPATATPLPTFTATATPIPTIEAEPVVVVATATPSPTGTATPTPELLAPPRIVGPRDGLVWNDGAIVFEFEPLDLASDQLYCLDTLRGFDITNTENWSFPPIGSEQPAIPIQSNVFRVARSQGIRCVVWTAGIGQGTCENIVSDLTESRVIGLPRPCDFSN